MKTNFTNDTFDINPNFIVVDYITDRAYDTSENEQDFLRLVSSIKENGLINSLILAETGDSNKPYELICGRRRLKAIRQICKESGESFKTPCRVLPQQTDRLTRNLIAYDDNKNRMIVRQKS